MCENPEKGINERRIAKRPSDLLADLVGKLSAAHGLFSGFPACLAKNECVMGLTPSCDGSHGGVPTFRRDLLQMVSLCLRMIATCWTF